jgi:hypothetical protein
MVVDQNTGESSFGNDLTRKNLLIFKLKLTATIDILGHTSYKCKHHTFTDSRTVARLLHSTHITGVFAV